MTRVFFIMFLFSIVSCSNDKKAENLPKDVIEENKFIEILKDQALIESALNLNIKNLNDVKLDSVYNFNVFEDNHVTKQQYDSTIKYYSSNPGEFKRIMDTVLERLNIEKAKR